LLEVSGIGDASLPRSKGIRTLYEDPSVGENLKDHVYVPLGVEDAPGEVTFESLCIENDLGEAVAEYTQSYRTSFFRDFGCVYFVQSKYECS
jgi:hypothetical protein